MGAISFNNKLYPVMGSPAASVSVYDNSDSGLQATNVQDAIDEIADRQDTFATDVIAPLNTVELTATAAHAHAVGTYFIWIGQLVETTVAISVGDTISDTGNDANVSPTTIANIMTAANSAIATKQNATDNSLTTTAKTITGAINELQSGKQAALTNPLTQSDVVNNLTSTATNVPLSAAMGKSLKDFINNFTTFNVLTMNQGFTNRNNASGYIVFGNILIIHINVQKNVVEAIGNSVEICSLPTEISNKFTDSASGIGHNGTNGNMDCWGFYSLGKVYVTSPSMYATGLTIVTISNS